MEAGRSSSSSVQVCDRCRYGSCTALQRKRYLTRAAFEPQCTNCRNANFPCEAKARLSKQSTPRSYVQYLEARVKQLEQGQETEWSPRAASSQHSNNSPIGDGGPTKISVSPGPGSNNFRNNGAPDWTILKELGMHVADEDGFSRYMGPTSGAGFSTMVMQEVLGDGRPIGPNYNGLFTVDDFTRGKALEQAGYILWELVPTDLPDRNEADRILNTFFIFTERVFPILHKPSFNVVVDELYSANPIPTDRLEHLIQFYFCLSVGYCFDLTRSREDRIKDQIRNLQMGYRCQFTTLHTRREGLTNLQTLALQAYALIMLRQRSEALRISAIANMKALECGLHHDGYQFAGNPLETEMRRRIFWCIFMLHLFGSSFLGLPRALHEVDITVTEPSNIDDDQLTSTRVLNALPGRTKIHRFVTVCRLVRILSRTLDVLYSHNKRTHASTRIEQMNRLCCEHLLDRLDFSFDEVPDDLPDADTQDPQEMAIAISHANEQLLYHYIRWLIHRPGLALGRSEAQFSSCLQTCTEASTSLLELVDLYAHLLPFIKSSPVAHPMTIFTAALTPLYRTHLLKSQPMTIPAPSTFIDDDLSALRHGISAIRNEPYDQNDIFRAELLEHMAYKVFGRDAAHQGESGRSVANSQHRGSLARVTVARDPSSELSPLTASEISVFIDAPTSSQQQHQHHRHYYQQQRQRGGGEMRPPPAETSMDWSEHRIAHLTAHEDLRDLVHEVFSPAVDPWSNAEGRQNPG